MTDIQKDPDHQPISAEFHKLMNDLAKELDARFNGVVPGLPVGKRRVGFFLTCFEFDTPGRFNYISNAEKTDVKTMLKDIVARIEARERMDAAGAPMGGKQ